MDKVLGKRHSTNPRFQLASSTDDTPDSSSAEDEEEPRPPPAKRKRGHVDELIEVRKTSIFRRGRGEERGRGRGGKENCIH